MQDLIEWIIIHLGGALLALAIVATWLAIFVVLVLEIKGWIDDHYTTKFNTEDEDEVE